MGRPNAFDGMLDVCVKLGWCGCVKEGKRLHITDFIPETGPVSADRFARWLIMADGLDPDQPTSEIRRSIHCFSLSMFYDDPAQFSLIPLSKNPVVPAEVQQFAPRKDRVGALPNVEIPGFLTRGPRSEEDVLSLPSRHGA